MLTNIASERMRELLDYWQDYCAFIEGNARLGRSLERIGPYFQNWRLLEQLIFDQRVEALNIHEWDFTGPMQNHPFLQRYALYPHELFFWNRSGRAAIHLPRELQRPYSVAPLPGIRFSDVKLQFNSFIIILEEPVRVEDQPGIWTEFDAIWVTKFPWERGEKTRIRCRLLRRPFVGAEQRRLSKNALRRVEIDLKRHGALRAQETVARSLNRWNKNIVEPPGHFVFPLYPSDVQDSDYIAEYLTPEYFSRDIVGSESRSRDEIEWRGEWICKIAKTVIGWLVHRKYLPSENYRWDRPPPSRGTRGSVTGVITNPENICTILKIGTLDIEQYREKNPDREGSTFFQYPHVRSGHWKRERGAGLRAPKTVWIEPYEVRKDLMPLFGIHGGKVTKVEGDL